MSPLVGARIAVAVALALRLLLILSAPSDRAPAPYEYEEIVSNILDGHGYGIVMYGRTVYRSQHSGLPYLALNGIVCGLTGHAHVALLLVQALIGAMLVSVVFAMGRVLFDPVVATVAALLTATHPAFVLYDTQKLHSLGLDSLLLLAPAVVLMRAGPDIGVCRRLLIGVLLAAGLYQRGTLILFALGAPLVTGLIHRRSLLGAVRWALPIFLGVCLTLAPWLARNYAIHGVLVMQTPQGEHFWRGSHRGATGTAYAWDGRPAISDDPALEARLRTLGEREQMRAFTEAAFAFWREAPGEGVRLFARKLLYFFTTTPTAGVEYSRAKFLAYIIYYVVCAAAAVIGLWQFVRTKASGEFRVTRWLPLACVVTVGLVQSAFYVETRHRWAVEPVILIYSAAGVVTLVAARSGRR